MAQCHRALGQKEEAIRAYKSYLRNSPDAPNAADVRRIVAELEAAVAEERRAAEANARAATSPPTGALAPVATPAPVAAPAVSASVEAEAHAAPAPRRKTWWIWPVAGVLVAGAAVGIAVGVTQSQSKEPSLTTVRFP
jgi:hypothetical protein